MTLVMAASFEPRGRLHYLDPNGHQVARGDWVLVPTDGGPEVARCVWAPTEVPGWTAELPLCAGVASATDLERDARNRVRRAEIAGVARALIAKHDLPMKVVAVDFIDRSQEFDFLSVVYFEAPHRVDFRALLSDLARSLRSRIDLRQIGARDAASLLGGIGSCGRELCCTVLGPPPEPISLRMARVQELPANPLQIAGACGRLLCCLAFEHSTYVEFLREAPALGSRVTTSHGEGTVIAASVPSDSLTVLTKDGPIRCRRADACSKPAATIPGPRAG